MVAAHTGMVAARAGSSRGELRHHLSPLFMGGRWIEASGKSPRDTADSEEPWDEPWQGFGFVPIPSRGLAGVR